MERWLVRSCHRLWAGCVGIIVIKPVTANIRPEPHIDRAPVRWQTGYGGWAGGGCIVNIVGADTGSSDPDVITGVPSHIIPCEGHCAS